MDRLIKLIEKWKEVGARPWRDHDKICYNNRLEYERLGQEILAELKRLYETGELKAADGKMAAKGDRTYIAEEKTT